MCWKSALGRFATQRRKGQIRLKFVVPQKYYRRKIIQSLLHIRMQIKIQYLSLKMNKKQQELFIAFFEELHEAEEAYESFKNNLSQCLGYNPHLLFDLISARSQSITPERLKSYLLDRVACNDRELYELFEKFDWSRQGFISREDFMREITPFGRALPGSSSKGTVTAEIQGHFIALLMEYTKRFRIIEVARKQVAFIAPYNAFAEIDYLRSGLIGLGQLQRFFQVNDFNLEEGQVHLLLHALRRRFYLEVNLQVFCENLDPLEFGQYEAYAKHVESEEEKQFLKRSRREEETMKRSRMQSQRIEHYVQKEQRRKRAELERQLQLEDRIKREIDQHEEKKQRHLRRALLEEDKNIRWNVQSGNRVLDEERIRNELDRQRNIEKSLLMKEEREVNEVLTRNAVKKEDELEASRKAYFYERELAYREDLERQREQIFRNEYLDRSREKADIERRLEEIRKSELLERKNKDAFEKEEMEKRREDVRRQMIERQSRVELEDKIRRQQQQMTASRSRYSSGLYPY